MPEGPTIFIMREEAADFAGRKILSATGNSKIDMQRLAGQRIVAIRTWGKHFLIELDGFAVRVHLLMFGSYRINERRESAPRLSLKFSGGRELNFYACAVKYIEGKLQDTYDWRADVMSPSWDAALARKKLRSLNKTLVCDALLDQEVFAGVGNIIKNEVLFRTRVHPLSFAGSLPAAKVGELVDEAHRYTFEFLKWKRVNALRKHLLAHQKSICPRCNLKMVWARKLGVRQRRSFYCENCQLQYPPAAGKRAVKIGKVSVKRTPSGPSSPARAAAIEKRPRKGVRSAV